MQTLESASRKPFELTDQAITGSTGAVGDALGRTMGTPGKAAGQLVGGTGKVAGRTAGAAGGIVGGTVGTIGGATGTAIGGIGGRMKKQVFMLDEIGVQDRELVGVQGASLGKMRSLDVPIPPTFIVSAVATDQYYITKDSTMLMNNCQKAVFELERQTGKRYEQMGRQSVLSAIAGIKEESRSDKPLLLAVRAVANFPMPDVMETLCSVGMNTDLVNQMAHDQDSAYWAYESYCQFLQTWGIVVDGLDHNRFSNMMRDVRAKSGVLQGQPLDLETLKILMNEFKRIVHPPENPMEQLQKAMESMINTWYASKSEKFMETYGLEQKLRVALIVQTMVYGNLDNKSGAGVAFSRNPITGETDHISEFLPESTRYELLFQEREPLHIQDLRRFRPEVFYKLQHILKLHETHFRDAHMLEFVVEKGVFYLIHATAANRSSYAGIRIAVDMAKNKLISEQEAIMRFDPFQLQQLIEPVIEPTLEALGEGILYRKVGKGTPASYGAVSGVLVFSTQEAIECRRKGVSCILCLPQTSANDIGGLEAANGVISLLGGIGSFASVWMRSMCKPAITSVRDFCYDLRNKRLVSIDSIETLSTGDVVTIDGCNGDIYYGRVPMVIPELNEDARILLKWAKSYKGLRIYSNVSSPEDAQLAVDYGVDGIELYNTDSLLTKADRVDLVRIVLMTDSEADRSAALTQLQQMMKDDFIAILKVVRDQDVIIRMIDYSLHDILPSRIGEGFGEEILSLSNQLGISISATMQKIKTLHEPNPLMGMRGCRLLIMQPYLLSIQVRAIVGAAMALNSEGITVRPRIQMPVAFSDQELDRLLPLARESVTEACIYDFQSSTEAKQRSLQCELGITLAVPRACLRADRFAMLESISFVTINTDELTQFAFGVEKEASKRVMSMYMDRSILARDPFVCLDALGVGQLIQLAINNFREKRSNVKINVVGQHSSDPLSIRYLDKIGVNELTVLDKQFVPAVIVAAAQTRIQPQKLRSVRNYFQV